MYSIYMFKYSAHYLQYSPYHVSITPKVLNETFIEGFDITKIYIVLATLRQKKASDILPYMKLIMNVMIPFALEKQ